MYRVGVCGESQLKMAKRVLSSANQGERTRGKHHCQIPCLTLDLYIRYLDRV